MEFKGQGGVKLRQFYEQVRVDEKEMLFYAECPVCRKRFNSHKIPVICRNKNSIEKYEKGKAHDLKQIAFNKRKVLAVRELAKNFNYLPCFNKWVCDNCYVNNDDCGACRECTDIKFKNLCRK